MIQIARICIKLLQDASRAKEQSIIFGRGLQALTDCRVWYTLIHINRGE